MRIKTHHLHECAILIYERVEYKWWKPEAGSSEIYGEQYDSLLPVKFELEPTDQTSPKTTLKTGQFTRSEIDKLQKGSTIKLVDFTVTSTRDHVLRLWGQSSAYSRYPNLRMKLMPQKEIELASHPWGATLEPRHAVITKTREDLLYEFARSTSIVIDESGETFTLDGKEYTNPLRKIIPAGQSEPISQVDDILLNHQTVVKLSTVHGDLNLNNIIVDQTGYPFVIDFANTQKKWCSIH